MVSRLTLLGRFLFAASDHLRLLTAQRAATEQTCFVEHSKSAPYGVRSVLGIPLLGFDTVKGLNLNNR